MKYVYMMRAGADHYKVGVATSVKNRVAAIQTSNPVKIRVVTANLVDDAYHLERIVHKFLKEHKVEGGKEWFSLTPDLVVEAALLINHERVDYPVATLALIGMERRLDKVVEIIAKRSAEKPPVGHAPIKRHDDASLLEKALEVVRAENKASTSLLQRRLSIGYGRASRVMDELEQRGIIGPSDGARARNILAEELFPATPEQSSSSSPH